MADYLINWSISNGGGLPSGKPPLLTQISAEPVCRKNPYRLKSDNLRQGRHGARQGLFKEATGGTPNIVQVGPGGLQNVGYISNDHQQISY